MSISRFFLLPFAAAALAPASSLQADTSANLRIGLGHPAIVSDGRVSLGGPLGVDGDEADKSSILRLSEELKSCQAPGYIVDIGGQPVPDLDTFGRLVPLSAMLTGMVLLTCEAGAESASAQVSPVLEARDASGAWVVAARLPTEVLAGFFEPSIRTSIEYGMNFGEWQEDGPGKVLFLERDLQVAAFEVGDEGFVATLFGKDAEDRQMLYQMARAMGHEPQASGAEGSPGFPVVLVLGAVDPLTFFPDLKRNLANLFALRFVRASYDMISTERELDRMSGKSDGEDWSRERVLEEALQRFERLAQLAR